MKTYKEGRCNTEAARSRCREWGMVEIPGVNHVKRHFIERWWRDCYRRIGIRVNGWIYKMAVGPVMMFGLEVMPLTKRQVAELKGHFPWEWQALTTLEMTTAQVDCFGDEAVQVCTCMLTMKSPGTRKRGRPHRTFIDVVMEDTLVWQKRLGWDGLFFFLVQKEEENVTLYNGYFVENPTLSSDG